MNSLISVIVPIYNAEKYLSQCIESILSQTYKNLEIILINDGSLDNSLNICNYYKSLDDRIIVIDKPNEGVSATRNLGIKLAKGDYIGFVDSDDYIEKNMYEVLLTQIKNDKTEVCAMVPYTINDYDKSIYKNNIIYGHEVLKHLLLLRFPTSLWAYLYSKDVIKNHFLNEQIHFFEDFEINYRILSSVSKVSLCKQKLYNYRINENSINSQKINDKRMTCLKIYDLLTIDKELKNKDIIKYAMYFRSHCLISAIASLSKSIDPESKYYDIIYENVKVKFWRTIISTYVPIKYKVLISLYLINPYLLCKALKFFKYKKLN